MSNVRTVQLSAKQIAWLRYVVFVLTARVLARRAEPRRDVAAQARERGLHRAPGTEAGAAQRVTAGVVALGSFGCSSRATRWLESRA
jgi:hypothetical protein